MINYYGMLDVRMCINYSSIADCGQAEVFATHSSCVGPGDPDSSGGGPWDEVGDACVVSAVLLTKR